MVYATHSGRRQHAGFVVGDISMPSPPEDAQGLIQLCVKVAQTLPKKVPTEQDSYWFVIEQYDRLLSENDQALNEALSRVPLFEVEYAGRRSESSYVGKPNPGVVFLDQEVMPVLEGVYGEAMALRLRAAIYTAFYEGFQSLLIPLRAKFAKRIRGDCRSDGLFDEADEWADVISALATC